MSELRDSLIEIQRQKNELLLPENIKKDVEIFGVTGILDTGIITEEEYSQCIRTADTILGDAYPYDELNYIESTGTQYIVLPYTPKNTTTVEIILSNITNAEQKVIYGAHTGWSAGEYLMFTEGDTIKWSVNQVSKTIDFTSKHVIKQNLSNISIDDESISTGSSLGSINSNFSVFASANGTNCNSFRLYSLKITENSEVIYDLIPVQKLDGTICLYNKIDNNYIVNQGNGKFISGGVK